MKWVTKTLLETFVAFSVTLQRGQKDFGLKLSCYIGIGVNEGFNQTVDFLKFPFILYLHYTNFNEA